jgi:hypothetical protein
MSTDSRVRRNVTAIFFRGPRGHIPDRTNTERNRGRHTVSAAGTAPREQSPMKFLLPRNSAFPTYLGLHRLLGGAHDGVASNGGLLHGEHDEFVLL